MELEADWDLYAIVRGSRHTAAAPYGYMDPEPSSLVLSNKHSEDDDLGLSSDCFFNTNDRLFDEFFQRKPKEDDDITDAHTTQIHLAQREDELHGLYIPFLHSSSSASPLQLQPKVPVVASVSSCNLQPHKRRKKNQLKKVCQVPADGLISSVDTWSWRKYGQKPIKGSPYPRGYYRCSTLKGCPARKQVERNRTDPDMFTVTYTSEHNHPAPTQRNSLAGTTRSQNQIQNKVNSVVLTVAHNTNVTNDTQQDQPPRSLDEEGDARQSNGEAEMMMLGLGGDVVGSGCASSLEMEDDFFDGLEAEIENVGDGYNWSPSFHASLEPLEIQLHPV